MIIARALTKRYGRHLAVDSVDFAIPQGRVVGFLGPNGAGKSTTIRMIAGYLPPSSGRVEVDGLDVQRHSRKVRQRIGYLPESAPLYTEMRVAEFLKFRAKLFHIPWSKRKRAIDLALRRCSLEEVRRRPIHQLSKGYRQRVGLAAALLHQPPVLILDEPTVGLDPSQIREFRGLIRELAPHHTILLSTHILPEVEQTCDHIIMIARGRVRAQGTLEDLRQEAAKSCRYVIETDSLKAAGAIRDLREIAGVESVALENPWRRLLITAKPGMDDLRERLACIMRTIDGSVRELTRETPTLEHLFVRMSAEAEAGETSESVRDRLEKIATAPADAPAEAAA
jgi:ABC-2 type transport system ATP-binding protein